MDKHDEAVEKIVADLVPDTQEWNPNASKEEISYIKGWNDGAKRTGRNIKAALASGVLVEGDIKTIKDAQKWESGRVNELNEKIKSLESEVDALVKERNLYNKNYLKLESEVGALRQSLGDIWKICRSTDYPDAVMQTIVICQNLLTHLVKEKK